jgi:hypothetical protein
LVFGLWSLVFGPLRSRPKSEAGQRPKTKD